MPKRGYVYILASKPNGTLYIGVTNDLVRRVRSTSRTSSQESRCVMAFIAWYTTEAFDDIRGAIVREKRLKAWKRP